MEIKMWSGVSPQVRIKVACDCKSVSASRPHHVVMNVVMPMLGLELLPTEDRRLVFGEG